MSFCKAIERIMKAGKDLRVFIVDDDPICREIYKQYLLNMGLTDIQLFDRGKDCMKELSNAPDLILIDYSMASPECLENIVKIKRTHPDIYLVFISEPGNIEVAMSALKYGAFDYIVKGNKEDEMMHSVIWRMLHIMDVISSQVAC